MPAGFEPARAEPNGLAVHLLNHSDKASEKNILPVGLEPTTSSLLGLRSRPTELWELYLFEKIKN